jgi:hypothetical protein
MPPSLEKSKFQYRKGYRNKIGVATKFPGAAGGHPQSDDTLAAKQLHLGCRRHMIANATILELF